MQHVLLVDEEEALRASFFQSSNLPDGSQV